ncbi:MAG: hypothetical protein ACTSQJ_08600 [Promethearchaeota archaeon]
MDRHKILYSELKKTDFFKFFNFNEVKFEFNKENNQKQKIYLKPGGFQEYIDFIVEINKDEILRAILALDREWIGDQESINPFGKDIAKSFLGALIPNIIDQEFKISLVQGIWNLTGSKDRVICIDEIVYKWEDALPEVKEFLNVYRSIAKRKEIMYKDFTILIENKIDKLNRKNRLFIILKWN